MRLRKLRFTRPPSLIQSNSPNQCCKEPGIGNSPQMAGYPGRMISGNQKKPLIQAMLLVEDPKEQVALGQIWAQEALSWLLVFTAVGVKMSFTPLFASRYLR